MLRTANQEPFFMYNGGCGLHGGDSLAALSVHGMEERALCFYKDLPKVELHAHLNGSISSVTMKKLMAQKPDLEIPNGMTMIDKGQKRTLEECFQMFQIIHQITTSPEDIFLVTKDVIKEFAADGVKYLELRSTPREEKTGMTKRMYVEAVLEGIAKCKEEGLDIDVRFLLSIDRRGGPVVAKSTVKLAEEFFLSRGEAVVGLDLSGDPTVGHGKDFLEPLTEARRLGLKLALHISEIPNQEEETRLLLGLPPDRIGHGTFLHSPAGGSSDLVQLVRQHHIPLELCMTSNVKGQTISSYNQHHFGYWYTMGHPVVLCTDDKGVFATALSEEYRLAAAVFNLTPLQIWNLSYDSINYIFASDSVKSKLQEKWKELKPTL
ncbi:adenosine deaminase-like protein isoform X2 [Rhinatrema bivittatum]|uniref:adenosine deaminase-like protein isoform X2 n=1 Tax=Rhinatrema bivittatum TaxID=194408 RepID=UPI00112E9416|nr:adenosine deaminase-like protein isoform X2 [Rhinatrema bivittatum]